MTQPLETLTRQIAEAVVRAFAMQDEALDRAPLPYLDALMCELVRERPLSPTEISEHLKLIVPHMQLGTAKRLVALKFGWADNGNLVAISSTK